jgi:hypothetical protein
MGHKLTGTEEEYPGMGFLDRPSIGTSSPAKTRDLLTGGNNSFFTIEIVSRGGQELNPIMAYYLNQSPLLFFVIKYCLTCAALILMLSVKIHYICGIRIRAEAFLGSFLIVLALVVQWQLFLIYIATD